MTNGKFATSISCIDGRIQIPIIHWIKANYAVDYVDSITESGMCKKLSEKHNYDPDSIKSEIDISVNKHKSNLVVISGHHDCAANCFTNEAQVSQIRKGVKVVESWNFGVKVVGIWVDSNWQVRPL